MQWMGKCVECEPSDLFKFMRLAILHLFWIYEYFEVERDPVRFLSCMLAERFAISHEFYFEGIGAVFFFNFFSESFFDGIAEIQSTSAAIPGAVFIAAILAA